MYSTPDWSFVAVNTKFSVVFEADPPWPEDVDAQDGTVGTAQDYGSQLPFYPTLTLTMTAPATQVTVGLTSTGQSLTLTAELSIADVIVIDMASGYITLNGISMMSSLLYTSQFFSVPVGSQTITVTTDGACTTAMAYRRRYTYA